MAVSVASDGSQTATISTEHTLFDSSAVGTYQLTVDAVNLAAGDTLELRVYRMVRTGGTRRVLYFASFTGAQVTDDMVKVSIPASVGITDSGAFRATLKQTAGTGRVFPWSVEKFA